MHLKFVRRTDIFLWLSHHPKMGDSLALKHFLLENPQWWLFPSRLSSHWIPWFSKDFPLKISMKNSMKNSMFLIAGESIKGLCWSLHPEVGMQNVKNVKTERVVPLAAVCVQCGSRRSRIRNGRWTINTQYTGKSLGYNADTLVTGKWWPVAVVS